MRTLQVMALIAAAGSAAAQTADPFIFVANNGNLEGSVSSMRYNPDGTLTLVDRVITGTRTSTSLPCSACNSYAISISPNGQNLATAHATGSATEDYTIYRINPDGTIAVVTSVGLPEGGLALGWVRDDLLAASVTNFGVNQLLLYKFEEDVLTLVDTEAAGGFLTSIAVHPSGEWIASNSSFDNEIYLWSVSGDDASLLNIVPISIFGTALEFSPDGQFLYASGGISGGGNAFTGYQFNGPMGTLTELAGSPYTSPGQSPKGFAFSPDGSLMFVSHGTDATIRVFERDTESGIPTSLGQTFDVGLQGTLQGMATLEGVLFALDNSTAIDGIQGAYALQVDSMTGALTPQPGGPTLTGGIGANDVVAWPGSGSACPGDIADDFGTLGGDGMVSFGDFLALLGLVGPCPGGTPGCDGDIADDFGTLGGDGMVSFGDFLALLGLVGPCE